MQCLDCNIQLQRLDGKICICSNCGREYQIDDINIDEAIDAASYCSASSIVRVVGKHKSVYPQNKSLLSINNNYDVIKAKKTLAKINSWVYQLDSEDNIPLSIIEAAADRYSNLQLTNGIVKRSNNLKGILAALIYNICIEQHIPKKPKVIANIANITEKQLSIGCKMLREISQINVDANTNVPDTFIPDTLLNTDNIIDKSSEYIDYIDQYFEKLNIEDNPNYKNFIVELINATNIDKIKISLNTARPSTRCAGAIFILCDQLKLNITRDKIADECNISKSTFSRFINMVNSNQNNEIRDIFIKYNIPLLSNCTFKTPN
jgi:transcription initiation factor TFIIIB Brf1 subunit/transcription initiation factor TFIIB